MDLQTEQKRGDIHRGRTGITGTGGPADRTEERGDIHRGRTGIKPEAIKRYCEHVFRHWRLQELVDCRQNRRERIDIEEEQASCLEP